jgi:hypothetical protein
MPKSSIAKPSIAKPSKIYPNCDFLSENIPSGNPVGIGRRRQVQDHGFRNLASRSRTISIRNSFGRILPIQKLAFDKLDISAAG